MKTLYLVRHASASIDSPTRKDIDRQLSYLGINEAETVAGYLMKNKQRADQIITSPAERASATAQLFAKHFFYPVDKIQNDLSMYEGKKAELIKVIRSCDNAIQNLLFIGHNPAITEVANELSDKPLVSFKPAGIARIDFEIENWDMLPEKGALKFYTDPQLLNSAPSL